MYSFFKVTSNCYNTYKYILYVIDEIFKKKSRLVPKSKTQNFILYKTNFLNIYIKIVFTELSNI